MGGAFSCALAFIIVITVGPLDHLATFEGGPTTRPAALIIGDGLPPVPQELAARIQAGEFVEMIELLPDKNGLIPWRVRRRCAQSKPRENK